MTANIDTPHNQATHLQHTPSLNTVDHLVKDSKVLSDEPAKVEIEAAVPTINKIEKISEQLDTAVSQLNTYVQSINRSLEFNIDTDSGQTVVKVTDSKTDELIRQIPNEEVLNIAKHLDSKINEDSKDPGLLLIRARA